MSELIVRSEERAAAEPWAGQGRPRRHPWEIPLLVASILATFSVIYAFYDVWPEWVFGLFPSVFIARQMLRATQRMNGVKICETQFPEAHRMIVDAARRFGLGRVPEAYVMHGNDVVNAVANGHGRRKYIVIPGELLESDGTAHSLEALRFVIGHEIGHIAAGHARLWRILCSSVLSHHRVPLIGTSLSRAQEYTADNHGYAYCREGAATYMVIAAAGKRLSGQVDFGALCDRATRERGLFNWLANLHSGQPVTLWRAAALRDRGRPGRLLFRPRSCLAQASV